MKCIVISGIDGSGKTTVINALNDVLTKQGVKTIYIWLRFNHYFAKMLHALARIIGLSVRVNNEMGTIWQHQFYKSSLFCDIYILFTYMDTLLSKIKYNKAINDDTDIVICDRWITDILVDLGTKTRRKDFLNSKWVKHFMRILPEKSHLFVVYRNNKDILDCRIENRVDPDFEYRNNLYVNLLSKHYINSVDNSGSIIESVSQIQNVI